MQGAHAVIFGGRPIGLLTMLAAKIAGAAVEYRRRLTEQRFLLALICLFRSHH